MITKPMLAGKAPADLSALQYPLLSTPKLDGIRCLVINGKAVSRTFKPIPNDHIRAMIEPAYKAGGYRGELDGELLVRGRDFNQLSGDVRRSDGKPDFYFAVFDTVCPPDGHNFPDLGLKDIGLDETYESRMRMLEVLSLPPFCKKIIPVAIANLKELEAYEEKCLAEGYEGVMVRTPSSPYKCGRSSTNEGYLLKVKRFEDAEAMIYGVEEEMENTNVATKDAFGRTERSTHKENMVPKGRMGKLLVRWDNPENGYPPVEFEIGTGFTAAMRQEFWDKRGDLIGRLVKFKHQKSGAKEGGKPRFPVFLGFRDTWDL